MSGKPLQRHRECCYGRGRRSFPKPALATDAVAAGNHHGLAVLTRLNPENEN
jgi:hypothetical protein